MSNRNYRSASAGSLVSLAALGIVIGATPVWAQTMPVSAPEAPQEVNEVPDATTVDEIVVTGSRIASRGFNAPTPTTVVGAEDLERRAVTNIGQALADIPAFRPSSSGVTANLSLNGTAGQNFADLRGLGSSRTLVLVDNRRFVPSAITGQVNLNLIPTLLVDRFETVTGGASAAWGSDAVAGVLNVILKKRLQGVEGTVQVGRTDEGDNEEYRIGLAAGTSLLNDRARILIGGDYVKNSGIGDIYSRDWGQKERTVITNTSAGNQGLPQRFFADNVHYATFTRGGLISSGPLRGTVFTGGEGTRQYQYGTVFGNYMIGGEGYGLTNFTYQPILPPTERYAVLARGDYDLTDKINIFAELSYGDTQTTTQNGGVRDQGNLTIRNDNPYLPSSVVAAMGRANITSFTMGRYNDDLAVAEVVGQNTTKRAVVGASGALFGDWTWDAHVQYGENDFHTVIADNRILGNFALAIDAVRNGAGQIVCRSTLTNPANGCVPINLFGVGNASAAALAYTQADSVYDQKTTQTSAAFNVNGELFNTWAGPVAVALGVEGRRDEVSAVSDPISQASGFFSGNLKAIKGEIEVKEAYLELAVPLARDVSWAKSLDLNGAVRYTDYSTSGEETTWKVGVSYEPFQDLRLRATRSHDIRAPNLTELFASGSTARSSILNPYTGISGFTSTVSSGNPALTPEVAETTTVGAIYQPSWLPGLRLSVDYYTIEVADVIGTITGQQTVDRCFAGDTQSCGLVTFGPSNAITAIALAPLNLNSLEASGIDFEAQYGLELADVASGLSGRLTTRLLATYADTLATTDAAGRVDRAGAYGNVAGAGLIGGVPRWLVNTAVTWDSGPLSLTTTVRYVGKGIYDATYVGPEDDGYSVTAANSISDNRVASAVYVALSGRYDLSGLLNRPVSAFFNVNNLFDKDPPQSPGANLQNSSNVVYYDVIGRTFSAGLRFKF